MTVQEAGQLEILGRLPESRAAFERLRSERPADPLVLHGLGKVLFRQGQIEEAAELFAAAVQLDMQRADFKSDYGASLVKLGKHAEAVGFLEAAISADEGLVHAHLNRGVALEKLGKPDLARESLRRAVEIDPRFVEGLIYLGINLRNGGKLQEATALFERARALRPDNIEVWRQLAALAADRSDQAALLSAYENILRSPGATKWDYSNLIATLHYHPEITSAMLLRATKEWADRHAEPLTRAASPPVRDRGTERPLRIGYVSCDLRDHPAGRLLAPVLAGHDRNLFEIYCYSDAAPASTDETTVHLARGADHWREIYAMPDEAVRNLIDQDRIDILVELNGHFGNHRLSLLARRCAPVQMSALAYCGTTGLSAIDYRVTDLHSDPPGKTNAFHTERLLRLPYCSFCYKPWDGSPDVRPPPSVKNGFVTFGNLNNPAKTADPVARAWARVLCEIPESRLLMLTPRGAEIDVVARFGRLGVKPNQLILSNHAPRQGYLEMHHLIDIVLDPFPFNGDNTTCDALWMGVPVVSLLGDAFRSRRGLSHLSAIGLPELVASSIEQYVGIASALARNHARLADLRRELRGRVAGSPLGDQRGYVLNLEAAYRRAWKIWCSGGVEAAGGSD